MKKFKSIPFRKFFNRKNGILFAAVSILLAVTVWMLPYGPIAQILAETKAPQTEYVSDVRVYTAATPYEAREACKDDGYIPVDGDLNEGGFGGSVVLGYQTTNDVSQAVTDVRMMQMTSGFSTLDYYEVVERQYPKLDGFIDDEYAAINEFAAKLDKGSYNAETAKKYLNLFTIPETKMLLGDYLASNSVDKKMLKKLFLQSTAAITTTLLGQLTLGVSDEPGNSWADKVYRYREKFEDDWGSASKKQTKPEETQEPEAVETPETPEVVETPEIPEEAEDPGAVDTAEPTEEGETGEVADAAETAEEGGEPADVNMSETPADTEADVTGDSGIADETADTADEEELRRDTNAELDKKYLDDTERLVTVLQDFATKYQNAIVRAQNNGGELPDISPEEATPDEMNEKGTDSIYVLAHDILNQYRFNDEMMLGDWLVEMGCLKLADKSELRQLYPLTASMSFGQIVTTELTGICSSALYLSDLSSQERDLNKSLKEAKAACRELEGEEVISVWAGVDQDMFSKKVAMTGDAQRYTNVKNTADNMVKRNKAIQVLENVVSMAQKATAIAGGVAALLIIPSTIIETFAVDAAIWYCEHFTAYMVFTCLGKVAAVIGKISKIVLIVVLIVMVIVWLYNTFAPECDDLEYTEIPEIAMDMCTDDNLSESNGLLRYDLIRGPDGKGDINAYNGKQWNALYYSKNTETGKPVTVPESGSPFIVQVGNSVNPAGYAPVRNFDEIYAANLNANVKSSDASQIYLFYSSPGTKANTTSTREGEESEEETDLDMPDGYIASLYLSSEDNETQAKLNLTKKGFKTIDVNLSPSIGTSNFFGKETEKTYTYLGYTVTKNKDAAVTDIRMIKMKSDSQAVMYGNMKYTAAGHDGRDNSICYTKDSNAGSPIRADKIQVLDSLSAAKKGSEPVSYLGGPPYNFDFISDNTKWDKSRYIFFTPAGAEENGKTEYISGLFFVEGRDAKESGYSLADYAEKLGGKMLNINLTQGKEWSQRINGANYTAKISIEDFCSYLCYTTTHDPKRAIYDVKLYTGTPKMNYCLPNITALTDSGSGEITETGYGVSPVFIQNPGNIVNQSGKEDKEDMYHVEKNVFSDYLAEEGITYDYFGQIEDNSLPGVKWSAVKCQPKALYTSGVKEGCEPLTKDDIVLSGGNAPKGFSSVRDFKFPYEKKPINMAYYYSEAASDCNRAYLYIKGKAPVKGKYISSLSLATYNPSSSMGEEERAFNDCMADDLCYITLLGQSSGGIINQNLAVKPSEAWYNIEDEDGHGTAGYPAKAAYLGASYTDDPRKAIHGIIKKSVKDGTPPQDTLKVGGATYSLVRNLSGSKSTPVTSPNGKQYYIYTSASAGASPAASPITEINVNEDVYKSGMATVLTVDNGDIAKQTDRYGNVLEDEQLVTPYGDKNESLFMHVNMDENLLAIDTFYVGTDWSEQGAQADLLSQGAVFCLPLDLNKGVKNCPAVYLGYSKYDPEFTKTRRTKYFMELAIKDLYVYRGDDPPRSIKVDGNKYTLVSKNSLNGKEPMYLYQTTALINNKAKEDASYITSVAAAQYDRVPEDVAENRWENLLTTDKETVDLNYGSIAWDDTEEMHIKDSRIHVFLHRNDNYIKAEGAITGGYTTDRTEMGDLVLNK